MQQTTIHRAIRELNGIPLFYRDSGTQGTPFLCLHGKYGRGDTFDSLLADYRDTYRMIVPDQRGHGLSGKPIARYDGNEFAADAHALLQALNAGPAIVLGHSIGGRNAAYLAAQHPDAVKALIIVDAKISGPLPQNTTQPEDLNGEDAFLQALPGPYATRGQAKQALAALVGLPSNIDYFMDSLVESTEGYDFQFSRRAMAAIDAYYQDWSAIWRQIRCPILLLRAQDSWYLSRAEAAQMVALQPGCQYREIGGSNHLIYADSPQHFRLALDDFLAAID